MDLLSLSGWSCLTSSNSPNRLISNNNIGPLFLSEFLFVYRYKYLTLNSSQLFFNNFHCISWFSVSQFLSHTGNNFYLVIKSQSSLLSDNFAAFSIILSSFGMSQNCPWDTQILYVFNTDLSSIGSEFGEWSILDCDLHILIKIGLDPWNMEEDWSNNDI